MLQACEKQWARLGCFKDECLSGTGDGGGENEGTAGIHALLEKHSSGLYVRRRCLAHLPWRVAEQGLADMGEHMKKVKAISAFLHESGTWNRMKTLAVTDPNCGGLGMCADGSHEYNRIFGQAPPKNMDERPDTTASLLEWLSLRSPELARLSKADAESRSLSGQQNIMAIASLSDNSDIVMRRVALVALKKSMFMYYMVEKYENISKVTSWSELTKRAQRILTSSSLDAWAREILHITEDDVAHRFGRGFSPDQVHWVEACVQFAPNIPQGEKDALLDPARAFQQRLVMRMQAHLDLVTFNVFRCPWRAARQMSSKIILFATSKII